MVLILNGIVALLIRIKGIKLLRGQTWVDDPIGFTWDMFVTFYLVSYGGQSLC